MKTTSFNPILFVIVVVLSGFQLADSLSAQSVDKVLRRLLQRHGVESLDDGVEQDEDLVRLGQALFFDRELSGNRDTSCATCHHPTLGTGDGLALPVGAAPQNPGALGLDRIKGIAREFVPRNAPEIFNRGSTLRGEVLWESMFWDSRIAVLPDGSFVTPAGNSEDDPLLASLDSVEAFQALFPVTSIDEMRGRDGDLVVAGKHAGEKNELAEIKDGEFREIWAALMARLMAIGGYVDLFEDAYRDTPMDQLTFADAARAIAAFEVDAFTFLDSPFDQYLAGENSALTPQQKRGAILFFGRANCANCHSGSLLTDQKHWALATPQLGPGKAPYAPYDPGRFLVTEDYKDLFAFRTPPLRNVAATAPYLHDGAFKDLRSVIQHHSNPLFRLLTYRPSHHLAQEELRDTVLHDWRSFWLLATTLDWQQLPPPILRYREIRDLEAFLHSLTAPNLEARLLDTIPLSVPSGIPVER